MDHVWEKRIRRFPSDLEATLGPLPRKWVWVCIRCGSMVERTRSGTMSQPPKQVWRLGAMRISCDEIILTEVMES